MHTLVSVIIPTHRRVSLLRQAVDSVLRQTLKPDEIIIVEDDEIIGYSNLKDESWASQVALYSLPGLGSGAARNYGVRHAGGRYVAFLDDDDLWKPEKLETQLAVFEKYPHLDLVFCDGIIFNEAGQRIGRFQDRKGVVQRAPWFTMQGGINLINGGMELDEISSGIAVTSSIMIKRSFFEQIGGFDENIRISEDIDLATRVNSSGSIAYVDSTLFEYRITSDSLSRNPEKSLIGSIELLKKLESGDIHDNTYAYIKRHRRKSFSSLANFLFSEGRLCEARHWYGKSLLEGPRLMDMVYFFATFFGQQNIGRLRRLKQLIAKVVIM
ncbi:MAG: glycosyltransferase family 2 protein [Syntrophobacteraceae bacterium]